MDLLRHLDFFVTVAEERHFGRAANRLGIAQPPLSQGVRRLESSLGVVLFDRGPRGVALTTAGRDLLPRARSLLDDATGLRRLAQQHAVTGHTVQVGAVFELGARATARVASAIGLATGATVSVSSASTVRLVDAVATGAIDVAVIRHPAVLEGVNAGPVVGLPTELLLPLAHPASGETGPVTLRALRDLSVATAPRQHEPAAHDLLLDTLDARGCPTRAVSAESAAALAALVATGSAFALTPDPDLCADDAVRRPVAGAPVPFRVRVIHRGRDAHPGVDAVTDALVGAGTVTS
jgi:DNA-binding transcriptional LysR family regulator